MSSEDDLQDFDSNEYIEVSSSSYSELQCEDEINNVLTDISEEENLFFSSMHELAEEGISKMEEISDECKETIFTLNSFDDDISNLSEDNDLNVKTNEQIKKPKLSIESYTSDLIKIEGDIIQTDFKTGRNKSIKVNKKVFDIQIMYKPLHGGMLVRKYNYPEKGYIKTKIEEKINYIEIFRKLKEEFKKIDKKLLIIQYRWSWIDLYLNNELHESGETYKLLKKSIETRLKYKYSILQRIIEGDDIPNRYMILLVLSVNKNIVEVYDGYFSLFIEVDELLTKSFEYKKINLGHKIKLFGCKYLLDRHMSILDYDGSSVVLKAFYNSYDISLPNRNLGYRKKLSFLKSIKNIKKEGGLISCIKGTVKKLVETRYVVQLQDYRNTVSDLEKEIEIIQEDLIKRNEQAQIENLKVRKFLNFIFADDTGECLITAWNCTDDIYRGCKLVIYGLIPVLKSLGIHLSTSKYSFMNITK